eukprot:263578-Chlamydomonas_euryale.AAC.2
MVAATDAMSREALSEALGLVLGSAGAVSALRGMESLGPLRSVLMPIPLPFEMLHAMQPAVALSPDDRQALCTVRALLQLAGAGAAGVPGLAAGARTAVRAAGEVGPLLPELLPGLQATGEMFARQLVRRMALRLADDLDPAHAAAAAGAHVGAAAAAAAPAAAGAAAQQHAEGPVRTARTAMPST